MCTCDRPPRDPANQAGRSLAAMKISAENFPERRSLRRCYCGTSVPTYLVPVVRTFLLLSVLSRTRYRTRRAVAGADIIQTEYRMQNTFKLTKTQGTNDNDTSGAHSYLLRTKKRQSETASVMCGHGFENSGVRSQHAEACGHSPSKSKAKT